MLWLVGILLALVAAIYLYWQIRDPAHTYRFRMTMELEMPEGLKSGSSVLEVRFRDSQSHNWREGFSH